MVGWGSGVFCHSPKSPLVPPMSPVLEPGQGEVGTACHQLSCKKWMLIVLLLYLHDL